jgi:hypothetical protein
MTCWEGQMPYMNEDQLRQATRAYFRAAMDRAWQEAWRTPLNHGTTSQATGPAWAATEPTEPPASKESRRTSLPRASASDKAGAIDVAFVRVR